jgi:hypothetical protein
MATKKNASVSIPVPSLSAVNPKVKIAGAALLGIAVLFGAYSVGHNTGFDKGHTAGFTEGNAAGDKAGFERGYWKGAEYGCNFVFDELKTPYVMGVQNPYTTWYALMGIGNVYLSRDNCSTNGHGTAPYSGGPTDSN